MTLGTFLLLKYKYYIHHMISMFIFFALGITTDFILGNYFIIKYNYVFILIIYSINEVAIFCYLKYMMDKIFYQYMDILLYFGITGLIVKLIIFSSLSIYEYKMGIDGILNDIYIYFSETNIYVIIFLQFLYILLDSALYNLLLILILFYLRPNHLLVSDEINVFSDLILYGENPNKYYTLIPIFFQILALLFYFEIIEFNFCNLNYNTAKNITLRERNDKKERLTTVSEIELGDHNYIIKEDEIKNSYDSVYLSNSESKKVDSLINLDGEMPL